jgi:hypothetical protein
METIITQLVDGITQQAGLGGWAAVVGGLGVVVTFTIRFFRMRWPKRFDRLHPFAKLALPFAAAAVGTLIIGIAGSLAAGTALGSVIGKLIAAAIGAGIAALGAHETSKTAGITMDMMMLKKNPDYEPGTLRKMSSLVVNMPSIDKANKILSSKADDEERF